MSKYEVGQILAAPSWDPGERESILAIVSVDGRDAYLTREVDINKGLRLRCVKTTDADRGLYAWKRPIQVGDIVVNNNGGTSYLKVEFILDGSFAFGFTGGDFAGRLSGVRDLADYRVVAE